MILDRFAKKNLISDEVLFEWYFRSGYFYFLAWIYRPKLYPIFDSRQQQVPVR